VTNKSKEPATPSAFLKNVVVVETGLLLFACAIFMYKGFWPQLQWMPLVTISIALLGPLLTFGCIQVITRLSQWAASETRKIFHALYPTVKNLSITQIVIIAIAAGVCEELLFRGAIQTSLSHTLGHSWALIIASLMFGLVHAMSVMYFLIATLIGLLLGAAYILTGDIIGIIFWHILYDIVALYIFARKPELIGMTRE